MPVFFWEKSHCEHENCYLLPDLKTKIMHRFTILSILFFCYCLPLSATIQITTTPISEFSLSNMGLMSGNASSMGASFMLIPRHVNLIRSRVNSPGH